MIATKDYYRLKVDKDPIAVLREILRFESYQVVGVMVVVGA
jgi:hypothetical protein